MQLTDIAVRPRLRGSEPYGYLGLGLDDLFNPKIFDLKAMADIEQVLREKKSFTLRCMLDGIKELQGRVVPWNRCASNVSITSACSLL